MTGVSFLVSLIGIEDSMSIRSYCSASSSSSQSKSSASGGNVDSDSSSSECEHDSEPPLKIQCTDKTKKYRSVSKRKYSKSWEKEFSWLLYDEDSEGTFCRYYKESGRSLQRTGGVWVTKPFKNWKKATEKMRAHEKSESHVRASEAVLLAAR